MTPSFITARRPVLALASTAVLLAACGGFTAVDVGGTVTGLNSPGLVLGNAGGTVSVAPTATTFVLPTQVAIRAPYAVIVVSQPPRQNCQIFNGAGIAGAAPVTIVSVICTSNTFTVGGNVTGLAGTKLVLTNGSDQVTIAAGDASGNASFTFAQPVTDLAAYGVAVLTQPANGQMCTVANGSAFVDNKNVTNVAVTCR